MRIPGSEMKGLYAYKVGAMVDRDAEDLTDGRLLELIGADSEGAFEALFARYSASATALARRVLRQPFLADEVVQEVFLSVWNNAATYDQSRGSVRSWLMLLTHRRAVDAVRREESVRRVAEAASREPLPVPDEPGDTVEQSWLLEEHTLVRESLAGLPEPQREVIELMYFSGLSQTKVAERLQIPLGTVKSRSLLAMKRLRRSIVVMER